MKLFVLSDIHGFYDIMIDALARAGYDQNNPDHMLICCGDLFDRGPQNLEVLNYFNNNSHCVLIRGNHEDLLEECLNRKYPYTSDVSNGTFDTIQEIGKSSVFGLACANAADKLQPLFARMKDYFEIDDYIFVHGWLPQNYKTAHAKEWSAARWVNGMDAAAQGKIIPNKTVVCGHWHCSYGHSKLLGTSEFGKTAIFDPYYNEGIIAIDTCTTFTNEINVIEIDLKKGI